MCFFGSFASANLAPSTLKKEVIFEFSDTLLYLSYTNGLETE
jgi:hypothetical protein